MAKQYKMKLFDVTNAIDRRDFNWLARQPEDVAKEFNGFITLRMAASFAQDSDRTAEALWLLNERVNNHLFDLGKHPDLVFRLLATCGRGSLRRKFMKPPRRANGTNKAVELLQKHYPFANHREIGVLLSQHTRESFQSFVADCGKSNTELNEIMQSYDAIQG